MANAELHLMDHPLILHKITMLRNVETDTKDFRQLVTEISLLIGYEATRDLPLVDVEVETPLVKTTGKAIPKNVCLVPVLRAGLGMVDAMLSLLPAARVGHIGLYRDEKTMQPVEYFCKLPKDIEKRDVFVVDPMLATGGSGIDAISQIKQRHPKSIRFLCLIAAPEGIARIQKDHPDVDIYVAALDSHLNDHGYIVPGLGDAGDRLFGTK